MKTAITSEEFNKILKKYTEINQKLEIIKQERKELNKTTKEEGYNPKLINQIIVNKTSKNPDAVREEEELRSLYLSLAGY